MENKEKIINYIVNIDDLYKLQVGDMFVTIEYSETGKSFNECMLNILKEKKRMS